MNINLHHWFMGGMLTLGAGLGAQTPAHTASTLPTRHDPSTPAPHTDRLQSSRTHASQAASLHRERIQQRNALLRHRVRSQPF
jgi:hypothetical protein